MGCLSESLRRKLLNVLDLTDIRFDVDYNVGSPQAMAFGEEIMAKAENLFSERTTEDWLAILGAAGVPAGPLRFTEELLSDEQVLANDMVVELEHQLAGKLRMAGPPVKMGGTPLLAKMPSPALGQHTDEVLGELGYSPREIQSLRDIGVTV